MDNEKVTPTMRKVIKLLQDGEVIVHDDRFFQVSEKYTAHRIQWRVWEKLTSQGFIYQATQREHFAWLLTEKGKNYK